MKKPLSKKAKGLLITFAVLAIVGICFAVIASYARTLATEGTYDPVKTWSEENAVPDKELPGHINAGLLAAKDASCTALSLGSELSVDDAGIETDLDEASLGVLQYMKPSLLSAISSCYPSTDGKFKTDAAPERILQLDPAKIKDLTVETGRQEGNETVDQNLRFFSAAVELPAELPAKGSAEYEFLNLAASEAALAKLQEEYADVLKIHDVSAELKSCEINGTLELPEDRLKELNVRSVFTVKAGLTFSGDLASLGEKSICFDYCVNEKSALRYAGLRFTEDQLFLENGEEKALPLEMTVNDEYQNEKFSLTFTSSDESALTISEDGVATGKKSGSAPVTVTATMKYMGKTYTETFDVFVVEPVKKLLVSPSSLTLKKGESAALSAAVTPANASVKDVLWFTEDESVATVSEDGTVTAVGSGQTKVFGVSLNGHFRSSCTVKVQDQEVK